MDAQKPEIVQLHLLVGLSCHASLAVRRGVFIAQDFRQFLPQRGHIVRLLDEAGQAFAGEALGRVLLVVAAAKDDRDAGMEAPHLAEGFFAVHVGHGQVEKHADDLVGMFAKHLQRFAPVGRRQDAEAHSFEHLLADGADRLLVVGNQDGPASAPVFSLSFVLPSSR